MLISDLFGIGAAYSGGLLSIPRANLEAMGLSVGNNDKDSLVTAVLLLVSNYFQGLLVDYDGAILIDDPGFAVKYDQNRLEPVVNFQYSRKEFSLDETKLFWTYLVSFYELD